MPIKYNEDGSIASMSPADYQEEIKALQQRAKTLEDAAQAGKIKGSEKKIKTMEEHLDLIQEKLDQLKKNPEWAEAVVLDINSMKWKLDKLYEKAYPPQPKKDIKEQEEGGEYLGEGAAAGNKAPAEAANDDEGDSIYSNENDERHQQAGERQPPQSSSTSPRGRGIINLRTLMLIGIVFCVVLLIAMLFAFKIV